MTSTGRRRTWPLRDYPSVFWLVAAVVVAISHRWVPSSNWLLVHLVLLGALSHAIVVWSFYFCEALLKAPPAEHGRRDQSRRIVLLLAGATLVLVGVPTGVWALTLAGASVVVVAVGWHGVAIGRLLRRALPGRFRVTIRYYLAAAASLAVGVSLGATLARVPDDPWHGRLLLAHTMANLLGWVGLTVLGTLVTFWPTLLRTRIDDRADRLARQALPVLLAGLIVLVGGALVGQLWVSVAGLAGYLAGVGWWGRALWLPLRTKPPREFASASVGAALPWAVVGLAWVGVLLVVADDWSAVTAQFSPIAAVFVAGFAAQLLVGALSYLLPTMLGGGPAAVRAALAWFNKGTTFRLVLVNAALPIVLLPVPSWVRVTVAGVGLAALASFLPLLVLGIRAGLAARRTSADERPDDVAPPKIWSSAQLVGALTALSLAVTLGIGVDPAAAGFTPVVRSPGKSQVQPTGEVVRVQVSARDMVFVPNQVSINAGDQLVIELVNDDPTTVHDLAIAGRATPRLLPGERAELDLGVIGASVQGWCTITGHRQLGMVFDIVVDGAGQAGGHGQQGSVGTAQVPVTADPDTPLGTHVDPVLAPLTDERVHRITLTVEEVALEVAPGVWQQRWTYNGSSVGPTLHGRVGDTFEITLVNNGTMGHSIDFHAGELAPDEPMRTIPPGESLVYTFTATRSGIWMYHCSTMPMSSHIAAGMHGAVIIEPDGLLEADRSYVIVQSEVYLGEGGSDAADATEVDAAQVATAQPDKVVFNGIANQYDQFPFQARVGERVRFWVLDAGPNLASSFHIVGGQFDTVYFEGGYHLRRGVDAFGQAGGGSQALGLQAAQGGFVELTFPEAGHYPVVSHIMSDAERGAHGIVEVTD